MRAFASRCAELSRTRSIRTPTGVVTCNVYGSPHGTPLVVIGDAVGRSSRPESHAALVHALSEHYFVCVLERPGKSRLLPWRRGRPPVDELVSDVGAVASAIFGVRPYHLLAYGLAAAACLHLLGDVDRSRRILSFAILGGAHEAIGVRHLPLAAPWPGRIPSVIRWARLRIRAMLASAFRELRRRRDFLRGAVDLTVMQRLRVLLEEWRMRRELKHRRRPADAAPIRVPTLCVVDEADLRTALESRAASTERDFASFEVRIAPTAAGALVSAYVRDFVTQWDWERTPWSVDDVDDRSRAQRRDGASEARTAVTPDTSAARARPRGRR